MDTSTFYTIEDIAKDWSDTATISQAIRQRDELKVYSQCYDGTDGLFYLKSEVDKVIADLEENHKKEVEQLLILNREQANAANRLRDIMERVIRHNKYKRCLAMARWCEIQFAYYIASCDRYDGKYVNKKAGHFYKWKYKWLELAEKFKEDV